MTRDEFREGVLARDAGKCVVCGALAADAHHIMERRLWPDGGYHLDNGASLCSTHHIEAEQTILSCEEIREKVGITSVLTPSTLYKGERYDKWGNTILANGMRMRGELFWDESVQKVLAEGGVLEQFTKYVKFPKISHFPWSLGVDEETDRVMSAVDIAGVFGGMPVVVGEKLDGECSSLYSDHVHARSIDGRNHLSRNWLKRMHASIAHDIPDGWRICGENVFAQHSIPYGNLTTYFYVFAIYTDRNVCLGWDDTMEWSEMLGLEVVPVIWRGVYDEEKVRGCYTGRSYFDGSPQEGYVMRLSGPMSFGGSGRGFAKFVRKDHVQTSHNWMNQPVVQNKLKAPAGATVA